MKIIYNKSLSNSFPYLKEGDFLLNILNILKIFPLLAILVYICIKFDNYMFKKSKSSRKRNKNKNKDSSKAGHLLISKEQMDMMIDSVLSRKRVFIYTE